MYPADQSVAFLTVALRRNRFCSDSDNWIWTYMLCIFPLSLLLDPRRSVVWRTPWLLWRWTTKSLLVPTLCPIRVCRRTWSLPNTTCCECRSSCPWQRRYFNGSVYLQLNASLVNRWCQVWTNRISRVMIVFVLQELDKKFQQTAAYRNMKEILTKKNEQIKEIRKRLQRWVSSSSSRIFHFWLLEKCNWKNSISNISTKETNK